MYAFLYGKRYSFAREMLVDARTSRQDHAGKKTNKGTTWVRITLTATVEADENVMYMIRRDIPAFSRQATQFKATDGSTGSLPIR